MSPKRQLRIGDKVLYQHLLYMIMSFIIYTRHEDGMIKITGIDELTKDLSYATKAPPRT